MSRHNAREVALHIIFSISNNFNGDIEKLLESRLNEEFFGSLKNELDIYKELPDKKQLEYIKNIVTGVYTHLSEIDSIIEKYSLGWKLNRISKISKAILRLSSYEILYMDDIPTGASINEAVEFAKSYDSDESASFVNGVLGSIAREEEKNKAKVQKDEN